MRKSYNHEVPVILIFFSNSDKKLLGSGFRFLARSGSGFNEYGSETLIVLSPTTVQLGVEKQESYIYYTIG